MLRKFKLDNGIPFVCEALEHVRSVALGVWVDVGARDEDTGRRGISHFLEHMHFKGTASRTAGQIADAADAVGGELNAYTSRESTTYYAKVLSDHTDLAVDLLSDILMHSRYDERELEREKNIILEEIRMVEDTPDDYIHDLFYEHALGREGLGQSVLGEPETVRGIDRENLLRYVEEHYTSENLLIAAAGRLDPDRMAEALNRTFGTIERRGTRKRSPHTWPAGGLEIRSRELAEAHLCVGVPGLAHRDPDRYPLFLLNTMLGNGVSSRLFQEIREKRGLAYSIYSFISSYSDTGIFGAYAGIHPSRVSEVTQRMLAEFRRFRSGVDPAALARAREQLKGNLILGLESTGARMNHLARNEICFGRQISLDEVARRIDAVSEEQVVELARKLFRDDRLRMTVLGPLASDGLPADTLRFEEGPTT